MNHLRQPICTDRLILRDITEADAELLFDLDSDPEVMRYIGVRPANDVEVYRERTRSVYLAFQTHPWHGVRIVYDRMTSDFLGWVYIRPAIASRDASILDWTDTCWVEVGYRYHRTTWGRGIATEAAWPLVRLALTDPETTAVVGCANVDNAASIRVLEKIGLTREREVVTPESGERLVELKRAKKG